MTRKRALYYAFFQGLPNYNSLVICCYTDGTTRKWHWGDRGFKAAKAKAVKGGVPVKN